MNNWKAIFTGDKKNGAATGFTVVSTGETKTLLTPVKVGYLESLMYSGGGIKLADGSVYSFRAAGGSAGTTDTALLRYVIENNNLTTGTELTQSDPSIPAVNNNKGFLTGTAQTPLLDFYKAFAYNEANYELMTGSRNIEISFLCSDRRYGVAGSRRAWSPYFKISDLEKPTFTVIQNNLTGTDQTAAYNIQGKITRNAAGVLFITLTDTHSGNNLYGAVLNIRHRVV